MHLHKFRIRKYRVITSVNFAMSRTLKTHLFLSVLDQVHCRMMCAEADTIRLMKAYIFSVNGLHSDVADILWPAVESVK